MLLRIEVYLTHLQNVLATVTDRKLQTCGSGEVLHYTAQVVTVSDYYPFGMLMDGRDFSSENYTFGFQGQEHDDAFKGNGNSVVFNYRVHDTRLGRFLSVDPLSSDFPWNSTYAFAENKVIAFVDYEGLESYYAADGNLLIKIGDDEEVRIVFEEDVEDFKEKIAYHALPKRTHSILRRMGFVENQSHEKYLTGIENQFNELSHYTYSSRDDAGEQFVLRYAGESVRDGLDYKKAKGVEYAALIGGTIIDGTEYFVLGSLVKGRGEADINSSNIGDLRLAGGVHTHGAMPLNGGSTRVGFSGGTQAERSVSAVFGNDIAWVEKNDVPLYLHGHDGTLRVYVPQKFEPGKDRGKVVSSDMPNDPNSGRMDRKSQRGYKPAYGPDTQVEYKDQNGIKSIITILGKARRYDRQDKNQWK